MTDLRALLERGLVELSLAPTEAQRQALLDLGGLVERWNARINLTGHRGRAEVLRRLVLESVALVARFPELESFADLGSGAGFPGLPMAILRPGCRVTLIESRQKRHHFQRAVCRELGLSNAVPLLGRAEALEPVPHAAAVAQAVASPEAALALLLRWVEPGGLAIVPGGAKPPQLAHPRIDSQYCESYQAPCEGPLRTLWIGRVKRDPA